MKKSISVLILLALAATSAFAQFGSVGGGLLFDGNYGNEAKYEGITLLSIDKTSFGAFAFFDATYVEVDLSFTYGLAEMKVLGGLGSTDLNLQSLGISVLGKYPIELGAITFFPLIGINYNLVLSAESNGTSYRDAEDLSQLGLLAGVGFDYPLNEQLFIRAQALFALRLPSKLMEDAVKGVSGVDAGLGFGPRIKVGVGYHL